VGSGTASAEVEDIGRPATAFPDDVAQGSGLFRGAEQFGIEGATPSLRPWRGDFTSLSVGEKIVSSPRSDVGPPPDGQDELNAGYSSSTLDGGLFPATVTDFASVDSLILNDQTLFGDNDYAGGLPVNAFGSWSLGPSNLDPSGDRTGKRGSGHCSSDGSSAGVIRCEIEEDLGSFMTTSPGAGSDGADQSGNQSSHLPGPNAPLGGDSLSLKQMLGLEMTAAQNSFATTWPREVIKGAFPPACGACDVTPPVVDGASAPAPDFGNPDGTPNFNPPSNFNPPPDPTGGGSIANIGDPQPATSVPEIPPPAMLLIGFAGLALIGRRRPWRSARLG
jgi:hypothetical protein